MPKGDQSKSSGLTDKKQPPSELTDTKQQSNPQLIGKINTKKFDKAADIKKSQVSRPRNSVSDEILNFYADLRFKDHNFLKGKALTAGFRNFPQLVESDPSLALQIITSSKLGELYSKPRPGFPAEKLSAFSSPLRSSKLPSRTKTKIPR